MIELGSSKEFPLERLNNIDNQIILTAEKTYRSAIVELVNSCITNHNQIILLAGPSSSGKTTTATKIVEELNKAGKLASLISLDNFYKDRELLPFKANGKQDLETIDAIDVELLKRLLRQITSGQDTNFPIFDFIAGRASIETDNIKYDMELVLVLEGIHGLNPMILPESLSDKVLKVAISTQTNFVDEKGIVQISPVNLRLIRRIIRDYHYRNYSGDQTIEIWRDVMAGEKKYIQPFMGYCDYHINSSFAYEPQLYKPLFRKMMEEIESTKENYIYGMLKRVAELDYHEVPKDSLLQEFLPKS